MPSMFRCALLASLAIGCGHPAAPAPTTPAPQTVVAPADAAVPTPLDEDLPRLADRAVKLYIDWQHAFEAAGTNCADAAAKMNALADANADLIAANQRVMHAGHDKVKAVRAELEKRGAEIDPAAQAIMTGPTMAACKSDPSFDSALDRLAGEG